MAGPGTSIPSSSIPPTSLPPLPVLQGHELVCTILQDLLQPFPFVRGLITSLLVLFGCPATG
jgi:hypothetical protein